MEQKGGSSYWSLFVKSHEVTWFFSFSNGLLSVAYKLEQVPFIYFLKGSDERIIVLFEKKWFPFVTKQSDKVEREHNPDLWAQILVTSYATSGKIIHFCELQFTNVH